MRSGERSGRKEASEGGFPQGESHGGKDETLNDSAWQVRSRQSQQELYLRKQIPFVSTITSQNIQSKGSFLPTVFCASEWYLL